MFLVFLKVVGFVRFDSAAAATLPMSPLTESSVVDTVSTSFAHIPANKHMLIGANVSDHWGWDNEFPQVECAVNAFAIRKTPITNAEFVPFIVAGGYSKRFVFFFVSLKYFLFVCYSCLQRVLE